MVDAAAELKAMTVAFEALNGLEDEQLPRVMAWLTDALNVDAPAAAATPAPPASAPAAPQPPAAFGAPVLDASISPKDFVREKKPKNGAERIACLAFYLSEMRSTPHFKSPDIVTLNTEAALSKIGNPTRDVDNAERGSGYLASAGNGNKQISSRGEALVRALPDRESVARALEEHPFNRRRPSKSTAKKAAPKPSKKSAGKLPKP